MAAINDLKKVTDLLASGQTEAAADLLLKLASTTYPEYQREALLLKNRLEKLQQDSIEGVLSHNEESIGWARISRSLVGLVDNISKKERVRPESDFQPEEKKEKDTDRPIPFGKIAVATLAILFLFVISWYAYFSETLKDSGETPDMETYSGRVISSFDRSPVAGAEVIFGNGLSTATTDADGKYKVELPIAFRDSFIYVQIRFQGEQKVGNKMLVSEETLQELPILLE